MVGKRENSKKSGRALEALVLSLQRALRSHPEAKVESRKRLLDVHTGEGREHDVVITIPQAVGSIVVAVECRDRSRPVGVPDVEGFSKKCSDTRVHRGVMVSPKGFWTSAKRKANRLGLQCVDLAKVDSFDWLGAPAQKAVELRIRHLSISVVVDPKLPDLSPSEFQLQTTGGQAVSTEDLQSFVKRLLATHVIPVPAELELRVPFDFSVTDLQLTAPDRGYKAPVRRLQGFALYEVHRKEEPFQLFRYSDANDASEAQEIAIAPVRAGDLEGEIVIVYNREEGGEVLFLPKRTETR